MPATTLADRAVVRLSGEGVRDFVQGLVTSDIEGPLPVWAGLLTPQGKCLFDFFVWDDGDDLLLDCEADAADDLIKRLSLYRLRRPIRIERDPSLAVDWSREGEEGVPDPRLPELGRRWLSQNPPLGFEGRGTAEGGGGDSPPHQQSRKETLRLSGRRRGLCGLGDRRAACQPA